MVSSPSREDLATGRESLDTGRRVAVQALDHSEAGAVGGLMAKLSPQFIGVCGRGNSFFDQHIIGGLDPSPSRAFFWFCFRPLAACDDALSAILCERAPLAVCSFFQRAASLSALHPSVSVLLGHEWQSPASGEVSCWSTGSWQRPPAGHLP